MSSDRTNRGAPSALCITFEDENDEYDNDLPISDTYDMVEDVNSNTIDRYIFYAEEEGRYFLDFKNRDDDEIPIYGKEKFPQKIITQKNKRREDAAHTLPSLDFLKSEKARTGKTQVEIRFVVTTIASLLRKNGRILDVLTVYDSLLPDKEIIIV